MQNISLMCKLCFANKSISVRRDCNSQHLAAFCGFWSQTQLYFIVVLLFTKFDAEQSHFKALNLSRLLVHKLEAQQANQKLAFFEHFVSFLFFVSCKKFTSLHQALYQ